jgi:acyl-CoA synthetase (AMP-forming)/AMP-acid ligase II
VYVPDLVAHGAARAPERPCIVQDPFPTLTFADVDDRASRLVRAFADAGLRRGDRVALLAPNEPEFLELQAACQRAGTVLVPLNFRLTATELHHIVTDCSPRLLLHGRGCAAKAEQLGAATVWHLGVDGQGSSYDAVLADSSPATWDPPLADSLAQIVYTSGTTGRPKGAAVSNGALFSRIATLRADIAMDEHDVFLQTLPLFHIANTLSFAFATAAATCITVAAFDADAVLAICDRMHVTHTLVVPTIIAALVAALPRIPQAFNAMQRVMYGAAPISPDLLERARRAFGCGFAQLYGMTESGIGVMLDPDDHALLGTWDQPAAGRDLGFYRTAVRRPDGRQAAAGEVGEITITGPGLFDHYWQNPAATADTLRAGWVHTGDAGFRDAKGYLHITDRIKDVIITGGENVYSPEVEATLSEHPDVVDVAVIGLPDERWGQAVHALIVARTTVDPTELDQHCRRQLGAYKCPKTYEFVTELPRNAAGKLLKHRLRDERTASARR